MFYHITMLRSPNFSCSKIWEFWFYSIKNKVKIIYDVMGFENYCAFKFKEIKLTKLVDSTLWLSDQLNSRSVFEIEIRYWWRYWYLITWFLKKLSTNSQESRSVDLNRREQQSSWSRDFHRRSITANPKFGRRTWFSRDFSKAYWWGDWS